MWAVERPPFDAGETFNICISRVRNLGLRERLRRVRGDIVAAAAEYEQRAQTQSLNMIPASRSVAGIVTSNEMVNVYEQRMAGKSGPGRAIYDTIKLLPKGDRCPFCDQRNISTLDHILPKALYPSLTVTPHNLVGACMECNKVKLDIAPKTQEEVILHPYFDDITGDRWLTAEVVPQNPCAIVFNIHPPPGWDNVTEARARRQFALFRLSYLYSSEAARELANIRYNLQMHFRAGGIAAVRHELIRQWKSRRSNRANSWQTAMYEAISHDDWFCNGGFA
jgi:hypothetical protein